MDAPYSEVYKLEFYVLGDEENKRDSVVNVTNKDLFKGDIPVPNGVYDAHMGTTSYEWLCDTCGNKKTVCPGHFGSIQLRYPVKNPLFKDDLVRWLQAICFNCGHLIAGNKELNVAKTALLKTYALMSKTISECPLCKYVNHKVEKDKRDSSIIFIQKNYQNEIREIELYNHRIKEILSQVTNETILKVGRNINSHPRNLILYTIRVPPNTIRPDIRKLGGNRSNNSDITSFTKNLVELNNDLPESIPKKDEEVTKELQYQYHTLDLVYSGLVKGASTTNNQVRLVTPGGKMPSSIASRIPKKTGRIRRNLMGKRTEKMARSVLTGDPTLAIDEIGISVEMATTLQIPETVRTYNKNRLNIYFLNKTDTYPGCSGIYIKNTGTFYNIKYLDQNYELQEGDVIMRDIIDGDYIGFNRQPSLLFGQIGSHRARVMHKTKSIRINSVSCAPYNADFDGDACNILVGQNIKSRIELQYMSWIGNWSVSYQTQSPYFGCYQDSLIGSYEITRSIIKCNKLVSMDILGSVMMLENIDKKLDFSDSTYSGRQLISKFLPKFNYPKKYGSMYMSDYLPFIKYDPEEISVHINRGELLSGCFDKTSVGKEKQGSIFHIINNEYGARMALTTIHNFQRSIEQFFLYKGYSLGIRDIILSHNAREQLKIKTRQIIETAEEINRKLNNRELINPISMTLKEFYEMEILNALEPGDDFVEPILSDIDFSTNKITKLVFTGSKGKKINVININGAYCQTFLGGKRPPANFSWGRTSPYFQRYDISPNAYGFIDTSYREGIRPEVFPFAAGEARFASISNALSTSISGAQSRLNIKNLETIIVDNMRRCTKKKNIIQMLYADNGIDTRKTEKVKFITAHISDDDMKKSYHSNIKMFAAPYHNKNVQDALDVEFKCLLDDRQIYRDICLQLEADNLGRYIMSGEHQMPVNPYRIIEDTVYNYIDVDYLDNSLDPVVSIKKVKDLCDTIGYEYFNRYMRDRKEIIPEYINKATTFLNILIRMYLCSANLIKKKINNFLLDIIIDKIRYTFKNSLVDYGLAVGILAAQCLSEPLTQDVLNSKHAAGGGGGTRTDTIVRMKEILGAKGGDKMKNISMMIVLKPEYEQDKLIAQEVANHIEMMTLERFLYTEMYFFEEYGMPVHSEFKHEKSMIKDFEKNTLNPKIPKNLSKWCIRYELNKEELIVNNISIETIISKLYTIFTDVLFVYTPETAEKVVIRCYVSKNMFKKIPIIKEEHILILSEKIKYTVLRGVRGIIHTEVVSVIKSYITKDGSIDKSKSWVINTLGSNLEEILMNPYVDIYRTQTDDIQEVRDIFGIDAARKKIINEIKKILPSVINEHATIFGDEMTYSGYITGIQRAGLQVRETSNVTLRLSFQSPIQIIENAAINGLVDEISGISAPLIIGETVQVGTNFNSICMNERKIEEMIKNKQINIFDEI